MKWLKDPAAKFNCFRIVVRISVMMVTAFNFLYPKQSIRVFLTRSATAEHISEKTCVYEITWSVAYQL